MTNRKNAKCKFKMKINIFVWLICFHSVSCKERESLDVLEGEEVLLQCRFNPVKTSSSLTLYWIRSNRDGSDNAAIESTSLDSNYRVERFPSHGQYDLKIKNTTYNRDNGNFNCMVKEAGTGKTLHTKSIGLTVLLKPSPPRIFPAAPVAIEGKPINLTCSSGGGSPPPQIKWYREGESQLLESTMILGATRDEQSSSVLTIHPNKNTDGAAYRCTVWNRALGQRQKLETRTSLRVNYFPRVTIGQHNPLRIEEGDTAVLSCQVDSKPTVDNVKWTRSERYIATTFRHVIPTVDIQDEGPYFCEADNNLGQSGKAELQMVVLHGPRVAVEPLAEVEEGGDVSIECKTSARPSPVSVVWVRADKPQFRQRGRFLQLKAVSHSDGGEYTCVVKNVLDPSGQPNRERVGNASVSVAVRHKPGPAHIHPAQPVGIEGKSVSLRCGASPPGHPAPSYTWWRSGAPGDVLATSNTLVIRPVRMSSEGEYLCQPYNNYGKGLPVSVQLQVVQEPRIVSGLSNQVIRKAGDTNLNLTCLGMGKPSPTATWYKDGMEIDESDSEYFKIRTSSQREAVSRAVRVTSTLIFLGSGRDQGDQVRAWDSGEFTCQFDNSVGRAQSAMALKVEHAPLVSHRQNKVAADLGEKTDVSCRMKSFPAPVFQWEKNGIPISNSGRLNNRSIKQISDYEYESTYTIWSVKTDSYGDYICKASNSMGSEETIVQLVKKGKPESPSKLRAIETGSDNIALAWRENFNGGMNNTSFKVSWARQSSSSQPRAERWCRDPERCLVEELEQHTTYILRVKAVNLHGESAWSEPLSVTTQIDTSQIPTAESIFFEKSTKSTSFRVDNYPLNLIAKLEVMYPDGSWQHLVTESLQNKPYKFVVNSPDEVQNVRVRICLESNDILCGAYNEASVVDKIQEPQIFKDGGQSWLMAVIIGILVSTLVTVIIIVKCCCRNGLPKRKYIKKEEELNCSRPDILHPSLSFDQKMTGLSLAGPGVAAHQFCERSSSGSGNRASVNSQDSLWQVKEEAGGEQDYAHYPRPEEYLVTPHHHQYNGDQYAIPSKIKTNNGGQTGGQACHSSLHSGLTLQSSQATHKFSFSFDEQEQLAEESQVSTPRKVIREIIV